MNPGFKVDWRGFVLNDLCLDHTSVQLHPSLWEWETRYQYFFFQKAPQVRPKYRQSSKEPLTQEVVILLEEIEAQQGEKRSPDSHPHWMAVPGPAHTHQGRGFRELHLSRCSHLRMDMWDAACAGHTWGGQRPGPLQMGFQNSEAGNEKVWRTLSAECEACTHHWFPAYFPLVSSMT